jgi:hypothetical protein
VATLREPAAASPASKAFAPGGACPWAAVSVQAGATGAGKWRLRAGRDGRVWYL